MGERKNWVKTVLALAAAALTVAGLGFFGPWGANVASGLLFGAAMLALALLLVVGLGVPPLRSAAPALGAVRIALVIVVALAAGMGANLGLYRHDVHFDLTRAREFTPPAQARELVAGLSEEMTLTYFYNKADPDALRAKALLEVLARSNPLFHLRAVDVDRSPKLARAYEIRAYNTAVVEVDGRRLKLERTTDLAQMAYAALRALRRREETVCFVTGHGEARGSGHVHYTHRETLRARHGYEKQTRLVVPAGGLDRLYISLKELGYSVREIVLARLDAIPSTCTAVVDAGPRRALAPNEGEVLARYLARGGGLLLLLDPDSPVEPSLARLLSRVGIAAEPGIVVDPLDHYGTDPETIAVPSYLRHPITEALALTYFPRARALSLGLPPETVTVFPLFGSSRDSYLGGPGVSAEEAKAGAQKRAQRILALAAEGRWPGGSDKRPAFRLVVVGDSDFVTNAHILYVSNADLALSAVRWLARDEALPRVSAHHEAYVSRITLTRAQMQSIFLVIEVLLPLSVALIGGLVWWRRR